MRFLYKISILSVLYFCILWLNISLAVEDTTSTEEVIIVPIPLTEEAQCLLQLNNKIANDSRFNNVNQLDVLPNKDLTKALFDEKKWSYLDLSDYNVFLNFASTNPAHDNSRELKWLENTDFLLRRTHIWTVIWKSTFVVSKILWFWKDSNFTFPLTAKSWISLWDPYKLYGSTFKEFLLYTHHSINWDFLSCWIFKLVPLWGRAFSEVSEAGYFTNLLNWVSNQSSLNWEKCSSGFEGDYITADDDKKYFSMKSNICVLDYAKKDFVKMELISIAYDNQSDYFNEYLVFPLQVKAMRDVDLRNDWLVEIRDKFLENLIDKTCLSFIHPELSDLPALCNWQYSSDLLAVTTNKIKGSYTYNFLDTLLSSFFIKANAARKFNFTQEELDKASWMVAYENVPYTLYMKMLKIEDKTFKDFLKMSLAITFEDYILARKEQGIVISPYEETFLKCKIPYSEREKIIIKFLENLKDPKNIDLNNLTYSNPKFWDCIVPYPDKRHLNKIIPNSFDSNQLLAKQLSWKYNWVQISENMKKAAKAQNDLTISYQQILDKLTQDFNKWIISSVELNKKVKEEEVKFNKEKEEIYSKFNISKEISDNSKKLETWWMITKDISNVTNNINYIIWVLFLVIWLVCIFFIFKKNKK